MQKRIGRKNKSFSSSMIDFPDFFELEDKNYMDELADERKISSEELLWRLKKGYGLFSTEY